MASVLLEADHLRKSFGPRQLLDLDHLSVYDGEKIGLIGENGAGKTTLLRLLSGETEADEGTVRRPGSLAFIRQQGKEDGEADDQMQALFRVRSRRDGLSGGEMTRGRIAAALSARPQLLFADEPTTDLDEEGLTLLRKQLRAFPGALVLVSHDRSLLRLLCRRIWYLEDGKITDFPGGYDAFMEERRRQRDRQQFEYDQYRAEQKRLKESVQRMAEKASSVRKAPSRMGNSEARLHKREWTDSVLQLSHAKRTLQNRMEHLEENVKTFSPLDPCTEQENALLASIADQMSGFPVIPCTTCAYCMPCPYGVDIPGNFAYYNEAVNSHLLPLPAKDAPDYAERKAKFLEGYKAALPDEKTWASKCQDCEVCLSKCPQQIRIPNQMARIVETLRKR